MAYNYCMTNSFCRAGEPSCFYRVEPRGGGATRRHGAALASEVNDRPRAVFRLSRGGKNNIIIFRNNPIACTVHIIIPRAGHAAATAAVAANVTTEILSRVIVMFVDVITIVRCLLFTPTYTGQGSNCFCDSCKTVV